MHKNIEVTITQNKKLLRNKRQCTKQIAEGLQE